MPNRLFKVPSRRIVGGTAATPAVPEQRFVNVYSPPPKSPPFMYEVRVLDTRGRWTGITIPYWSDSSKPRRGVGVNFGNDDDVEIGPTVVIDIVPAKPAIPARPGYEIITGRAGWDGGARSVRPVRAGQRLRGEVKAGTIGVLFGLASDSGLRARHWIEYGIELVKDNGAAIVERGVSVRSLPDVSTRAAHVLEVRRLANGVQYLIDDEVVHTSLRLDARTLFGASLLYSETDAIDRPSIESLQSGGSLNGRLPGLRSLLYQTGDFALLDGRLPVATGELGGGRVLPSFGGALAGRSAGWLAQINGRNAATAKRLIGKVRGRVPQPALVLDSSRDTRISYSALGGFLPAGNGQLGGLTGRIGGIAGRVPAPPGLLVRRANGNGYGAIGGTWPRSGYRGLLFPLNAADLAANVVRHTGLVLAVDGYFLDHPIVLLLAESITAGSTVDVQVVADAEWLELLSVSTGFDLAGEFTEHLASVVAALSQSRGTLVNAPAGADGAPSLQIEASALGYAVNIVSGALSECTDLNYTHLVRLGQQLWAAGEGGLYRLGDDDGTLSALLDLGGTDYGNQQRKTGEAVFVGIRTDGQVYLRVLSELGEHVYRGVAHGDVQRFTLGRGLGSRRWSLQLEVTDASFAQIDSVEIEVANSARRLGSRQR